MGRGLSQRSRDTIAVAASILARIHPASIRAVCYQLFTAGWLDSMAKKDTNRVSTLLTWAREHDDIPWAWIVDETRAPERISAWADPAAYAETVSRAYRRDRWTDQPSWIEVWSEKGTIRGTLAPVLNRYGVTFRVLHGYGSATALHEAADESWTDERDRELRVLYCGDWDPSGLHMSEVDLPARLEAYDANITIQRLALDEDDVTYGRLPSFPAESKRGDSRHAWFVRHYGERCWELDALDPNVLRERVRQAIDRRLDHEAWERAEVAERAERDSLVSILNDWPTRRISGQASE